MMVPHRNRAVGPAAAHAASGPPAPLDPLIDRLLACSAGIRERAERGSFEGLLVRVGALLVLSVTLELILVRLTRLPATGYRARSITLAVVEHAGSASPVAVIPAAFLLAAVALVRIRGPGPDWPSLDPAAVVRPLVLLAAGLLTWTYSTYPYNFYFDRSHAADRLLLLSSFVLIAWRPAFLIPFLLVLFGIVGQFGQPIGGFSWAAPMLPIRILILTAALWTARLVTRRVRSMDLVFLICCLVLAHYWVPGLGKLRLGWLASDQVAHLLPATYASGWLGFLEPATISRLTVAIAVLNGPIKLGTLLVECGALLALYRPVTLRAVLIGAITLHAAIFATSGIAFWSWMLLDAGLLVLLLGGRAPTSHLRPSLLPALRPPDRGWRGLVPTREPRLAGQPRELCVPRRRGRGEWPDLPDSAALLRALRLPVHARGLRLPDAGSPSSDHLGRDPAPRPRGAHRRGYFDGPGTGARGLLRHVRFDTLRTARFDALVGGFVEGWNRRSGDRGWWARMQPPPSLWTFSSDPPPISSDRVALIVVHQVTTLFDGRQYLEIRARPVRSIALSPSGADRTSGSRRD
jgi:hypothetical protein